MIGMLQIITYLLCVYLVFKGFEILQIALMSPIENKAGGVVIGILLLVISIGAAFYFTSAIDTQAAAVSRSTNHP
jgi:glucose-6-phosphate-specific signal transduction histidine kinase